MDEIKEANITRLATVAHERREYFAMLGICARSDDPDVRRQQAVDYELARARLLEAEAELRNAQAV